MVNTLILAVIAIGVIYLIRREDIMQKKIDLIKWYAQDTGIDVSLALSTLTKLELKTDELHGKLVDIHEYIHYIDKRIEATEESVSKLNAEDIDLSLTKMYGERLGCIEDAISDTRSMIDDLKFELMVQRILKEEKEEIIID